MGSRVLEQSFGIWSCLVAPNLGAVGVFALTSTGLRMLALNSWRLLGACW